MQKVNLAFAGCGFLGLYHTGVSTALKCHGHSFLKNIDRFSGSSSGALNAALIVCDAPIDKCVSLGLRIGATIRSNIGMIPWQNMDKELRTSLANLLPLDAHVIATEKLFVSVTSLKNLKPANELISEFESREFLIDVLANSCFIPLYSGWSLPKIDGVWYIDGAYTDNMPHFEDHVNYKISPIVGKGADICPDDKEKGALEIVIRNTPISLTANNVRRVTKLLIPPNEEALKTLYLSGYKDGKRFLKKHGHFQVNRDNMAEEIFEGAKVT